ncbi:MAG TPA: DUF308 domain-containing protein [Candidatus Limnocylindrales bacterium]|jgi:uncharacterized membrane protein HdeD (DUF308 family)
MSERYARNWWMIGLRGLLAIVFGLVAIYLPDITLRALILLFGAFAIVDGALNLGAGLRGDGGQPDWWAIVAGLAGIAIGVAAALLPELTAVALLIVIGSWALLLGIIEVVAAIRLRDRIQGELLLALDGLVSIAFGLFVIVAPGAGALALVWLIGAFAIASGILLLAVAVRLYQRQREAADRGHAATG